ncbi:MAG: ammonium transporter [Acidimicrobiia bacterium]|nr:MAG: ammonium transporter [Acidimicrobiia bacterium]
MLFDFENLNAGDTAWLLASAALVMFMTPGLALFYGGMVRTKNVLAMLMQNFFALGLVSVLWGLIGYSLAFGGDGPLIGNFDFVGLKDVATMYPPDPAGVEWFGLFTFPPVVFAAYQMMFAVITPALITGAIADRMRFSAWVWFLGLWAVIVYTPVAHWVFSPSGWLFERGALDFAGGTVVHINAGIAALAAVLVLGRRRGWPERPMPPHSLPLTLLGTGILWFGWFGFNAGSAGAANGVAGQAFMNTHMAAAAAMLGWLVVERIKSGHATTLGAASGAVAGLVAITPCAGFVGGIAPLIIGAVAGVVCFLAIQLKTRLGYDDSLDVVGVHLVGGLVGSLLLAFFADPAINAAVAEPGIFITDGGTALLVDQLVAVGATLVFSFVLTFVIVKALDVLLPGGVRVPEEDEETGLDLTQHSEVGYSFAER